MQKIHVRNIFCLVVPFLSSEIPNVDLNTATANFGFTITYSGDGPPIHYRLNLYSDFKRVPGQRRQEVEYTSLMEWAKKSPITFQKNINNNTIDGVILRLRIGPGFDFRKVQKRFVRFGIECFVSGTCQRRATSRNCKLLSKRRVSISTEVDEVMIPIFWQEDAHYEQIDFDLPDIDELLQLTYSANVEEIMTSPSSDAEPVHNSSESNPQGHSHDDSAPEIATTPNHIQEQELQSMYSQEAMMIQQYGHQIDNNVNINNEQYMVLYNGNAEVVGNFRALNFYKASDINIKEDIRLLMEDDDPRSVLLKIDGVSYKFKPGTTHSTNKRFVGYIAQQIESVVPEAVQLIDGILHVDYESLIPYLSESIKQNFVDINTMKSEQYRIKMIVDMLYEDFLKREKVDKTEKRSPKTNVSQALGGKSETRHKRTLVWQRILLIVLGTVVAMSAILAGLYFMIDRNIPVNIGPDNSPDTNVTPTPIIVEPPHTLETDRQALIDLFIATNGGSWNVSTIIQPTGRSGIRWLSDVPMCEWTGITCNDNGNKRVTALNLSGFNLHGTIPESLGKLDAIVDLNLSKNNLTGTLPKSMAKMKRLLYIYLSENPHLSGNIPDLPLTLQRMWLDSCNLTGTIPASILEMNALSELRLNSNQLTGTIPPFQDSLDYIFLGKNQLEGTVPVLSKAEIAYFYVNNNKLNGTLENLKKTKFRAVDVSNNNFTGEAASYDMKIIVGYYLSNNQFTSFNSSLPKPPLLMKLHGANNPWKCPVPDWLTKEFGVTCN